LASQELPPGVLIGMPNFSREVTPG